MTVVPHQYTRTILYIPEKSISLIYNYNYVPYNNVAVEYDTV
jgi:hypothetical protein